MSRRSIPNDLAHLGLFLLVLAAFLVPRYVSTGTLTFSTPQEQAGISLYVPFQVVNVALWSEGVPLWNPWSACGTPHLANLQSSVFYPLNALFLVLPTVAAAEILLVVRLVLCGFGAYAFGRSLRLTRGAATFLALGFTLNSWELRFANDGLMNSDLLLPLMSMAYVRLGATGRLGPALGASVLSALHVFAGLPEAVLFGHVFVTLLYLFTAFLGEGRGTWGGAGRKLAVLFGTLSGGALLAAVQLLPFLEYLTVAWSTHLGHVSFDQRRSPPEAFFALAYPFLEATPRVLVTRLTLGAVGLLFLARGLVRPMHGGLNFFLGACAALAVLKLFGVQPIHSIGRLPGIRSLDFPYYLIAPLLLSLLAIAAMGLDDWWRARSARSARGWILAAPLLVLVWVGARGVDGALTRDGYAWALLAITFAAILVGLLRRAVPHASPAPLLGLVLLLASGESWLHFSRIGTNTQIYDSLYREPLGQADTPLATFLGTWMRTEDRLRVIGQESPNISLLWGPRPSFEYWDAIMVDRYRRFRAALVDAEGGDSARLRDLAAVRAVVLRGDGRQQQTRNLMKWLSKNGFPGWEGDGEPRFERHYGERPGGSLVFLSSPPFAARLPRFALEGCEAVVFEYGVEGAARDPVLFELTIPSRKGEVSLFAGEIGPGEPGWRRARVELPPGLGKAPLQFTVTSPDSSLRAGLRELGLVLRETDGRPELETRFRAPPFTVFENPRALPRAYVCHEALVVEEGSVLGALQSPEFVPGRTVVLEEPSPIQLPGGPGGLASVRFVESGAKRVVLEVEGDRDGLLVLSDTYYPGWTARVDGERRPILPANLMFRAVPVEKGRHVVEFVYRPWSFRAGASISVLALLGVIGAALRGRATRPGRPPPPSPAGSSSAPPVRA